MRGDVPAGKAPTESRTPREIATFLVVGTINTLLVLGLYQALLFIAGPTPSYLITYAVGMVIAYTGHKNLTFRGDGSAPRIIAYITLQISLAALGTFLLNILTNAGLSPRIAIIGVIAILTPINFLVSRVIFTGWRRF